MDNFTKIFEDHLPALESLNPSELAQIIRSLETVLFKAKELVLAKEKAKAPMLDNLSRHLLQPLDKKVSARTLEHIKLLDYKPSSTNTNSPKIFLYGAQHYRYNKQSGELAPVALNSAPVMEELVTAVNGMLNAEFNSVLINKYSSLNCCLGPHKDDEELLDPQSPVATLSLGQTTRRLQISLNKDKSKVTHSVDLIPESIFVMLPGFQEHFYHAIAVGRKSRTKHKETGERYSITFRRLIPPKNNEDMVEEKEEEEEPIRRPNLDKRNPDGNFPDTLVFGSSLTKTLKEDLLSKHSKNFKVFSNGGAHFKNIAKDVRNARTIGSVDPAKVTSVFLVCGGNDVEGLARDSDIRYLFEDFEELVGVAREAFPNAKLNMLSLIPRRVRYSTHVDNMHDMNTWLSKFCCKENIRFVDIFSFFLKYDKKDKKKVLLNKSLFNRSELHFNGKGDSVLGKVLIAVANKPRAR
jgi:alkylated DNA repair dioxygenase AlkB/lysophospholipase L1-like esterase